MVIRIGSRGSKLALWQAEWVKAGLQSAGIQSEVRIYTTEGDMRQAEGLKEIGGKGLFTKALDEAMLRGEIDIAVHSAKDMPVEMEPGIELAALLKREDPRDVLLAIKEQVDLDNLNQPPVIGTSSVRRQALLRHYVPHVQVRTVRGNVDTRIRKMENGEYDGILLALAGVKRLGLERYIVRYLNTTTFTPAAGQGAVAVACVTGFAGREELRAALNHSTTETEVTCERAFLRRLGGGCSTPAFGLATARRDSISFNAGLAEEDGSHVYRVSLDHHAAEAEWLGTHAADLIIQKRETQNVK